MMKMKWLPWTGMAVAMLATPTFAQQETPASAPKDETKVVVIKKRIDDKGVETIERIEKTGGAIELDVEVTLDEMNSDQVKQLEQSLDKISNLGKLDLEIKELKNPAITEDVVFMFKDAKTSERPFLGVLIETNEAGVKITKIIDNGAAKAAGLQVGDIIKDIDGTKIESIEALQNSIGSHKIGETVKIAYIRDNQPAYTNATLKERATEQYIVRRRTEEHRHHHNFYQTKSENFDPCKKLEELRGTPFIGVYINTDAENGAGVSTVIDETGASRSKLQAGDVITKLAGDEVSSYQSLEVAKKKHKPGETVRVTYMRDGKKGSTRVTLTSMADREVRSARELELLCDEKQPETPKAAEAKEEISKLPQITNGATLEVFPNPAEDFVNVQFDKGTKEQATLRVMTVAGKEVMRRELNGNTEQFTEQLDLSKLPAGMYIITVTQGETVLSKQVALKSF